MRTKKVVCLHPWVQNLGQLVQYLHIEDPEVVEQLVWDQQSPEIVIATEHIYSNSKYFKLFKRLFNDGKKKTFVFHAGESISPDLNIFDYAIVYNRKLEDRDRISRIPPNYFHSRAMNGFKNTVSFRDAYDRVTNESLKFCNFIYSNPHAFPTRDQIFNLVSRYRKVDSLGAHLNNTNKASSRGKIDWKELSIKLKSQYKFSIAAENEYFEGYTTEKLLTSFQAHSIPIYWGNPDVAEEYNSNAFINCHEFSSLEEIIDRIRELDRDDEKWAAMVSQPWQTEEQEAQMEMDMKTYQNFIKHIIYTDSIKTQRRPMGTWSDIYYQWFSRSFISHNFSNRVKRYLLKK